MSSGVVVLLRIHVLTGYATGEEEMVHVMSEMWGSLIGLNPKCGCYRRAISGPSPQRSSTSSFHPAVKGFVRRTRHEPLHARLNSPKMGGPNLEVFKVRLNILPSLVFFAAVPLLFAPSGPALEVLLTSSILVWNVHSLSNQHHVLFRNQPRRPLLRPRLLA